MKILKTLVVCGLMATPAGAFDAHSFNGVWVENGTQHGLAVSNTPAGVESEGQMFWPKIYNYKENITKGSGLAYSKDDVLSVLMYEDGVTIVKWRISDDGLSLTSSVLDENGQADTDHPLHGLVLVKQR